VGPDRSLPCADTSEQVLVVVVRPVAAPPSRSPLLPGKQPPQELARLYPQPAGSDLYRGDRSPFRDDLPPGKHWLSAAPPARLGSRQGALPGRRDGEQASGPRAAGAVGNVIGARNSARLDVSAKTLVLARGSSQPFPA